MELQVWPGMFLDEERYLLKESSARHQNAGNRSIEVANEGKVIMSVDPEKAEEILDTIRKTKYGADAQIIGEVTQDKP
jgi:hydrogenase expression/formation protein HypE